MISSLSNLADRNFVLGFMLPVIIATLAAAGIFQTVWPLSEIWQQVGKDDDLAKLTIAILFVWTVAVLLLALNHALYQFMEGYWGPFKFFRTFLDSQHEAFDDEEEARRLLQAKTKEGDAEADGEYWESLMTFRGAFPANRDFVLPTRFGNVLRAFETYSMDVYGIDAIPGWLRLSGVIPDSFQKLIDNARAEVDFFLNTCLLAAILALCAFVATLHNVFSWPAAPFNWRYLAAAALAPVVSAACYRFAVARAPAWGDLVRAAFDLYLPDMIKKMGFEIPQDEKERLALMDALNGAFLLNRPIPPVFRRKTPQAGAD